MTSEGQASGSALLLYRGRNSKKNREEDYRFAEDCDILKERNVRNSKTK